jgi:hypothetical protein
MATQLLKQYDYEVNYEAKEQDIRPLLKVKGAITPQDVQGVGLTARVIFPDRVNGRVRLNLSWPFVTKNASVFASATEVGADGTAFVGAANYLANINSRGF